MTTTVFTDAVTLTAAAWFNDVNNATYEGVGLGGTSSISSAASPDIFAATTSHIISYTGTVTCTGFATAPRAGTSRALICTGAAPFTAGANLIIPGTASGSTITFNANTRLEVVAITTTQFQINKYEASFKVINTTFDLATATGATLVITGVGFKPRFVDIMIGFSAGSGAGCESVGWSDGAAESYNSNLLSTGAGQRAVNGGANGMALANQGGGASQNFSIATGGSFDADGCTIKNTKSGAPAGTVNICLKFSR